MSDPTVSSSANQASLPVVPFREKLGVGTGGLLIFYGNLGVKSMAVPVYQMILGVNPALLGLVLAIPRLWDAFIDPFVGNLSDNSRSRFGRRRPFIIVGAIAMALAYGGIWLVSPAWSETGKLVYLLITSMVFYTCYAFYAVPYQGLTFELSPSPDERTRVMAHSAFWYAAGGIVYLWVFSASQMSFFSSPMTGVRVMNWLVAIFLLAGMGVLPGLLGRERFLQRAHAQPRVRFWEALGAALRHKALLILVLLTLLKMLANMVGSSMDHYLFVYYMHDGDLVAGSYWKSILSTAYALVGFASIPAITWLSERIGKKGTVLVLYALTVVAGFGKWMLFRPGISWWVLIDPLLSAPILAGVTMVIPSMMADVCDSDELASGQRREGMFGAVFLWIQKTGIALAFFGTGLVLQLAGFDAKLGGHQSPETFFWMRTMLAGATSTTAALGFIAALFYPITREMAEETRRLLEARRGRV